ncbi:MAG: hypothetical protein MIO92_04945 [Methanosarcinaceae archaeon]|nr:hypothetical protein [Methanosarcinaceae archaeon]
MTKKADTHYVYLNVDPKTGRVDGAPIAHGCRFDPNSACKATQYIASGKRKRIMVPPGYIYLDVGVWAGNKFNFGLICGRNVWLCNFTYRQKQKPIPVHAFSAGDDSQCENDLLNTFIKKMSSSPNCGFEIVTYAFAPGFYPPRPDLIYVILPDMHLPPLPDSRKDLKKCRYIEIRNALSAKRNPYKSIADPYEYPDSPTFFDMDADIFKEAGYALFDFLYFLRSFHIEQGGNMKVIHIGDLFELWQGMGMGNGFKIWREDFWNRVYIKEDKKSGRLIFDKTAGMALKHRIEGIEIRNDRLMQAFKALDERKMITYLYGNHDVYLVEDLRKEYVPMHVYDVEAARDGWSAWTDEKYWGEALADRLPRLRYLYESNISFEHGHRMDVFNQDGEWKGPFITDLVYWCPPLRLLDPDRVELYHRMTAVDVYYNNYLIGKPISVFVMGHSHMPRLDYIQFCRLQPGDRREGKNACLTCKEAK